jgi:ankyrin repeat protein
VEPLSGQEAKLFYAARKGKLKKVVKSLQNGADINAKDEGGFTPLHEASFHDRADVAELLIARGANVNARDNDEMTPLHSAAIGNARVTAELLISKGADVNGSSSTSFTPLHEAVIGKARDFSELLITHGANVNAVATDALEVKVIMEGKEYATAARGYTPLHLAAFMNAQDTAEVLIAHGADVNFPAENGYTPLHTAAFANAEETAEFLIIKGADVNAKAKDGATPLDVAAHFGRAEVSEVFKKHKRDLPRHADAEIASLISLMGRRDLLGTPVHLSKLLELGDRAIPYLIPLLESDDVNVVADAAKLLGKLGARQAIPKLLILSKSLWAEVHQASLEALAFLDKRDSAALLLDRRAPFEQIGRLWTAIIQGWQMLYPPEILHAFCVEAIGAMPGLNFASKNDEARAWGMLGSLLFKSLNPEWPGGFDGTKPCPEARRCCEEALRCEPGDSWWEGWVRRFS